MRQFKEFVKLKESVDNDSDWTKELPKIQIPKGLTPPPNLRPVIRAFLESKKVVLHDDLKKPITMPKKSLYLVGGPVRDLLAGKTVKDYDLVTNATPEQICYILAAAEFRYAGDKSGKTGSRINLPEKISVEGEDPVTVKKADDSSKKTFFIKKRDEKGKIFIVGATVKGESFDISTMRSADFSDKKADFVDDIRADASKRDITINSMYLELTKADGENKALIDPNSGMHDLNNGSIRAIGKADDSFKEDPVRALRSVRFHSCFGKGEMDKDLLSSIKNAKLKSDERVPEEFIKGISNPDLDAGEYLKNMHKSGLLGQVFPDAKFATDEDEPEFVGNSDKALTLAWLLRHNPSDYVEKSVGSWDKQLARAISFLLKLKSFSPKNVRTHIKDHEGTGVSGEQIKNWIELFNIPGTKRNSRPWWKKQVSAFADYEPQASIEDIEGMGLHIDGFGLPIQDPEDILGQLEADFFKEKLGLS